MQVISQNALSPTDAHVQWAHREVPMSRGHHVPGRVPWRPQPQSVPVESRLEAEVLGFLLLNPHLVAIHSQPFTLSWWDGQKHHRYTPDFLVVLDRLSGVIVRMGFGYWTVVEVKPARRLLRDAESVARNLHAIRELLGFSVVCFTEEDLPARGGLS